MVITYNDLYIDTRRALISYGLAPDGASVEARELVCAALGLDRNKFFAMKTLPCPSELREKSAALLEKRLTGIPLAYLLGEWDFCGETFAVDENTLIPRDDSAVAALEAASDASLTLGINGGCRVLDLCCGTGCLGITVALRVPGVSLTLADISEKALLVAARNAKKVNPRPTLLKLDALDPPPAQLGRFDVIVCNPPYIPTEELAALDPEVRDKEPSLALDGGRDGLAFYRSLASKWRDALRAGGSLVLEHGYDQSGSVRELFESAGWRVARTLRDDSGVDRCAVCTPQ